jgi:hypothetical protein
VYFIRKEEEWTEDLRRVITDGKALRLTGLAVRKEFPARNDNSGAESNSEKTVIGKLHPLM